MKEFIWKVCCLIWHFDERVIREYEEKKSNELKRYKECQFESLKNKEEEYWNYHKRTSKEFDDFCKNNPNIDTKEESHWLSYMYGTLITDSINAQNLWNDYYDKLIYLGRELGNKEDILKELFDKRNKI